MKIRVKFDALTSRLIIDGYKKKHAKSMDDASVDIDYYSIPEYIKLGKQVRRRERLSSFIETWGAVLFWVVIIGGYLSWTAYSNYKNQINIEKHSESNYQRFLKSSNSSKSGIYEAESCPITTCEDGSCSSSTGRGTCSHHGGVAY